MKTNILQYIYDRREYLILAAMLEFLHAALWSDFGQTSSQALLLIHLGLFLIWQPIQKGSERFTWYNAAIFIGLMLGFIYWINWWLIFAWLILLIGITGGRVVTGKTERYVYFLVMIFLILELLIACIPSLAHISFSTTVHDLLKHVLPVLPLILPFFGQHKHARTDFPVDLLHAITASLLISLLALGALVIMYESGADYFTSLIQSLLAIGICLLLISWLLSAHTGFNELSQLWSRSLLSIGTPFEQWLSDLSALKDEHQSPVDFLEAALERLVTLSWMSGVKWQIDDQLNIHGIKTMHQIEFTIDNYPIILYTRVPIGGALLLHCKLLIKLIEYFYLAKQNENELSKRAHMQAIYETGARITHDIKNLLQSMHSMVTIIQADNLEGDSKSLSIVRRQFPYFIQRLEQAMNKLQAPDHSSQETIYLRDWWRELQAHYKGQNIEFSANIKGSPLVSYDLFDSVTENLLENAIAKRRNEDSVNIKVTLLASEHNIILSITDSGQAIDKKVASILFKEPVKSDNGLGIGLLQAHKQAEASGYQLNLKHNYTGNVTFELRNENA